MSKSIEINFKEKLNAFDSIVFLNNIKREYLNNFIYRVKKNTWDDIYKIVFQSSYKGVPYRELYIYASVLNGVKMVDIARELEVSSALIMQLRDRCRKRILHSRSRKMLFKKMN